MKTIATRCLFIGMPLELLSLLVNHRSDLATLSRSCERSEANSEGEAISWTFCKAHEVRGIYVGGNLNYPAHFKKW